MMLKTAEEDSCKPLCIVVKIVTRTLNGTLKTAVYEI